ncbi:MAG: hypothetical protein K6B44_07290 [Lachnospiraceae bacterium]|nr:hypothetical protein [Lachnospiraceae bacterium]
MNVNLLYADKEWEGTKAYYDWNSITKDLGLDKLFKAAEKECVLRGTKIDTSGEADTYLGMAVKKVMRIPLRTEEEVKYRQDIIQDCIKKKSLISELYEFSTGLLEEWEKLGRKNNGMGVRDAKGKLITDIRILKLLVNGMSKVRTMLENSKEGLESEGFTALYERLVENFSEDYDNSLQDIIKDLTFFSDATGKKEERGNYVLYHPRVKIDCGLTDGLKISDLKLEHIETIVKQYTNPRGIIAKISSTITSLTPGIISLYDDQAMMGDAAELEYQAVYYVYSVCSTLLSSYGPFFDQLRFQTAFYLGVINIRSYLQCYHIDYCFPVTGSKGSLKYKDLKEVVMNLEQGGEVVGNSGSLDGRQLVIITGANQGGKSTFLRSIGIAQVMFQCGLMVAAKEYRSGLYSSIFAHFTRREDSAMNSGRLDEELRRMDQIVSNLDENSLLLLNESFATTTEKEGSAIAYDIVRALKEQGVSIFTVTHLLSFAQRVYEESKDDEKVAFLSAEHLEDGSRTYRMIPHEPEITSFGLELYDRVLGSH